MRFRAAKVNDKDAVLALYRGSVGTPFCIWDASYPGPFEIERDLAANDLFVLEEDGGIIGAISINPENEHDGLDCWSIPGKAGEFSRVVLHPAVRGKHLAKVLVSNVLSVMKSRGCEVAHIAVAKENLPAWKTYVHFGFQIVDQRKLWGLPCLFYLCELSLSN